MTVVDSNNKASGLDQSHRLISKSKFLWGRQCAKLLWFALNDPDRIPAPAAAQQAIFDQGHKVGALTKQLYPDGIEVAQGIVEHGEVIKQAQAALLHRRPLFEAAFAYGGAYARADILNPVGKDGWDIIEVKSTTEVKDVHLHDLALQAFVYTGAGLKIRRCVLMHINKDFIRRGPVDPRKFFVQEDVTAQVSALTRNIEPQLDEMFSVIRFKAHPDIAIGPHCDAPYTCPLHEQCWSFLPDNSVLDLYRGTKKGFKLLADGISEIKRIPPGYPLTDNQHIQREAALTGHAHVDKTAIRTFLRELDYPVAYLDFETFSTAIPLFDNTGPYRQVPFQFSLHIVPAEGRPPQHRMFLAEGRANPRPEFLKCLRDWLPANGSVVVYNASFERGRLQECCELHPAFKPWLAKVEKRMVDLLQPFRGFRYYHPAQCGSASMKAVLPALTGRGYGDLAIQEGGTASMEFLRVTFGDVPEAERLQVRQQPEQYCGQDTEGMIWIVEALRKLAG